MSALLAAKGLRVATYTSPHLVDFRERMIVGGVPIPADDVVEFIERYTPLVEEIGASFFEATTAMAFDYFARARRRRRGHRSGTRRTARFDERRRSRRRRRHVDRPRSHRISRHDARGDRGREGGHLQARACRGDRRAGSRAFASCSPRARATRGRVDACASSPTRCALERRVGRRRRARRCALEWKGSAHDAPHAARRASSGREPRLLARDARRRRRRSTRSIRGEAAARPRARATFPVAFSTSAGTSSTSRTTRRAREVLARDDRARSRRRRRSSWCSACSRDKDWRAMIRALEPRRRRASS